MALFKTTSLLNFLRSVTLKLWTFCFSKLFILDKLNDLPTKQFSTTCNIVSICRDWALLFERNEKAQLLETINKISRIFGRLSKKYLYFLSLPKSFASKIWRVLKKISNLEKCWNFEFPASQHLRNFLTANVAKWTFGWFEDEHFEKKCGPMKIG